jgi:hypothetical protein
MTTLDAPPAETFAFSFPVYAILRNPSRDGDTFRWDGITFATFPDGRKVAQFFTTEELARSQLTSELHAGGFRVMGLAIEALMVSALIHAKASGGTFAAFDALGDRPAPPTVWPIDDLISYFRADAEPIGSLN